MTTNGDNEAESNIPLGPALIVWAALVGLGGFGAFVVWLIHRFIVPIPFW